MRKPHVFVPKFYNQYQVVLGETATITHGTSRREVLQGVIGDTPAHLKSVGRRTVVYDTQEGTVVITRLGRGERLK